jgi:hypothetical protein
LATNERINRINAILIIAGSQRIVNEMAATVEQPGRGFHTKWTIEKSGKSHKSKKAYKSDMSDQLDGEPIRKFRRSSHFECVRLRTLRVSLRDAPRCYATAHTQNAVLLLFPDR